MYNTQELMHCHCGTNNRAPWWTFTDPCKPEVRPGAREESASPAWLAALLFQIVILQWRNRNCSLYIHYHSANKHWI